MKRKLTEKQKAEISRLWDIGESVETIAKELDLDVQVVLDYFNGDL